LCGTGARLLSLQVGERQAHTRKGHADKLSSLQGLGFRSERPETVERRGHGRDDEEIEDEGLGRTELGRDEGETRDDNGAHHTASDDFHPLSHDKAGVGKRETVDRDRDQINVRLETVADRTSTQIASMPDRTAEPLDMA
jgi:hypothetical protein